MLKETLEVFENMYKNNKNIIFDTHIPKDGTYYIIEINDGNWIIKEVIDIYYDKKEQTINGANNENFSYIRKLDYYSKLIDMNKPIDSKKVIHTNNYFSFAVKKDAILNKKMTSEVIKGYYDILKNPKKKYEKKSRSKKLYETVEEQLGEVNVSLVEKIENYILTTDLFEKTDLTKKDYLKIYFVFPDEEETLKYYEQESQRYMLPNLYNSNDYNIQTDDGILGLHNNNMGMNAKKPFLEHKTRNTIVPILLDQSHALMQTYMFDYLLGKVNERKYNFYIDFDSENPRIQACVDGETPDDIACGFYMRCRKEKNEVEILKALPISGISTTLEKSFIIKNVMGVDEEKTDIPYDSTIQKGLVLEQIIDKVFFDGFLSRNYFTDAADIRINNFGLKRGLLENRDALYDWLKFNCKSNIETHIDLLSLNMIQNSLKNYQINKARNQFNLRWSLLDYINEERRSGEQVSNVRNELRKHINLPKDEEWNFGSDEEFCYAVGQIATYFLSLNKSKDRPESFINTFMNAKNVKLIKRKIEITFKKYNYAIQHFQAVRVRQLLEHIMDYEPANINSEYIMAGFVANSLIYEKKEEKENG